MAFGDYQNEIYLQGLGGVVPKLPMVFAESEAKAEKSLPPSIWSYVAGGAGDERTQRANAEVFAQWGLMPRMFVGAAQRDLSVDLFGLTLPSPLFMAPIGVIALCAQDGHGDLATARAAARTGVPMVMSTLTEDPLEDVAAEFGDTPGFFQLYTPTDRDLAASLVHRAEAAGFKGIVVTLDTWVTGWRPRDLGTSNFPQLRGKCLANYTSDPVFRASLAQSARGEPAGRGAEVDIGLRQPPDLERPAVAAFADHTALAGEGHLSPRRCPPRHRRRGRRDLLLQPRRPPGKRRNTGAGLPARAWSRPPTECRCCSTPGIRSGADVVKALALGATAVGVGRPYAYGLALDGVDGIVHVLRSLLAEADLTMAVDGYPTLKDLTPDTLRRVT